MEATYQKLGCYTQAFGIGILPLYKDNGGPLYGEVHRPVVLDKLARVSADLSDETLFKSVRSLLSEKSNVYFLFFFRFFSLLILFLEIKSLSWCYSFSNWNRLFTSCRNCYSNS